jgi:nucleotide-binding universal stress UspA family protein
MNDELSRPFHILLAVDGSQHSLAAVKMLSDLPLQNASPEGATITALAVVLPRHAEKRIIQEAILEGTQKELERPGVLVHTGLLHGEPAGELVKYADEHDIDLIILGALGLRSTLGILLGGVAQQVVEYTHRPVLIVRAPYNGLKRLLLLTDGSPSSQKAADYLCGKCKTHCFPIPDQTELRIAHVLPPSIQLDIYTRVWPVGTEALPYLSPEKDDEDLKKQTEEEERNGRQLLEMTTKTLEESMHTTQKRNICPVLLRGDAASEVIDYARGHQIDLIVAGSRGLSTMQSWLLGSVSRKLVHYAGSSVLIVK